MQLAPYLFFKETCEEALQFYAEALGGRIAALNRFEGSPMATEMPPDEQRRVMHATFEAPGLTFMAFDAGDQGSGEMRRVALSLASSDADEGRRAFDALCAGGSVTMPYEKQFWGQWFGMLVDRYGVRWMVNAG